MKHLFIALLLILLNSSWGAAAEPELEIRVIYDNTSARAGMDAHWGFSSVVTFRGRRLLFDSGTRPALFLENLRKMGIAPSSIEKAMISHQHPDHINGIFELFPLHARIEVYFLEAFPAAAWQRAAEVDMRPQPVSQPRELLPGAWSTGMLAGPPPEHSLAIESSAGIVLLVGCSHPGIVNIVHAAKAQRNAESIHLVLGGFHMLEQNEAEIRSQIRALRALGVERVMPAHCTGDLAKRLFEQSYGAAFELAGAGKIVRIGPAH